MADCKYMLPCGRCDKHGKACEFLVNKFKVLQEEFDEYKRDNCDHKWISHGATVITTKSPTTPNGCYEYLLCEKCGKHMLRPYVTRIKT